MREVRLLIPDELEPYVEFIPESMLPKVLLNILSSRVKDVGVVETTTPTPLSIDALQTLLCNLGPGHEQEPELSKLQNLSDSEEKEHTSVHIQLRDDLSDFDEEDMGDLLDLLK